MAENFVSTTDKPVEVPFSDDAVESKEADLDEDQPTDTPAERLSRKQRRAVRAKEREDERKQSAQLVKELREKDAAREREIAELRGYVTAQAQHRAAAVPDGKDQFEQKLDAIYQKRDDAYRTMQAEMAANGGKLDDKRAEHYASVAREVERDVTQVHVAKALAAQESSRRQEQAQQVYIHKYPDVYANPRAFAYAQAEAQKRQALGENITNATVDEIMNDTMVRFKLGGKQPPAANLKERMSGVSSSGAGNGNGNSSGGIAMTREFKMMARAKYSDLPEEQAIKKWVDNEGKALRAKKVI